MKFVQKIGKKIVTVFLILCLLISHFSPFISYALAASSPWSQTNWSTGDFSSASNVATSTPNQTTLTLNEKLSNTGIESALTGWDTTSTFKDVGFSAATGAVAAWPLDDTTSTQSYSRVINPAVATGRNIVVNGTFDADANWTKGTGWTIAGGVAHSDGTGVSAAISEALGLTPGKAYSVTYTVSNYVSGTVRILVGGGGTGTNRTANGTYTETVVAVTNGTFFIQTNTAFVGDIDSVTVTQLNIPANTATPSQLLADGDMEAVGTTNWTLGAVATVSKQTTNPHSGSQYLRIAYNGVSVPYRYQNILVANGGPYRVTGYMRGDGSKNPYIGNSLGAHLADGTSSTAWQPFDVVFMAQNFTGGPILACNASSAGFCDFDDVTVSLDTGIRSDSILSTLDGDMEKIGTTDYTVVNGAVLSKETTNPHGGSQVLRITATGTAGTVARLSGIRVVGKTYRITGFARGDGVAAPSVGSDIVIWTGTTSTSWQSFDVTRVATVNSQVDLRYATGTNNQYVEFDDVSVTEVDPLVGVPTNGVTLGSASGGHLTNAYTFDGSNDFVNISSTDLNSAFSSGEGTFVLWAKVSGAGVWSDGTQRVIASLTADASNRFVLDTDTVLNQIRFRYIAGATAKEVDATTTGPTGWFQMVATWSKSNDQLKTYINGVQVGSTQTGLGTWVGNLSTTSTIIGASSTSGNAPWSGMINDVRLYNTPLSSAQILALYNGVATTRDTATTYNSSVGSAKIVAPTDQTALFTQSVNVGDTSNYNLTAYAYTDGSAVTSSDASLSVNGSTIATTYTSAGGGWYKLSGTTTGTASSIAYGVQVEAGKTVYLDNFSLSNYPSSGTLTSSIFDTGQSTGWGTLTYSATTPTNTTATVKVRTSNSPDMTGATDFSSCTVISSGSDISSNSCVTDGNRYAQYQITLATSDNLNTSTFSSFSLVFFDWFIVTPTLESPADNEYTSSERPQFKWKAPTGAANLLSYSLAIDNGDKGSFTISGIPVSRTTDYETSKYIAHYENFSDSDSSNNYVSVITKSSNEWSTDSNSGENDGKVKEGKRLWTVKAIDNTGVAYSASRTLFVDRTLPTLQINQINNIAFSGVSFATTDTTPSIFGKITDPLGSLVASGPREVNIKVEKKVGLTYQVVTLYTINIDKAWWECDNTEISDNTKQICNKYLPFEYLSKESLPLGNYKITVDGGDNAGNKANSISFNLNITTSAQISATPPSTISEPTPTLVPGSPLPTYSPSPAIPEVPGEITVPLESKGPSIFEKVASTLLQTTTNIFSAGGRLISGVFGGASSLIGNVFTGIFRGAQFIAEALWSGVTYIAQGVWSGASYLAIVGGNIYSGVASRTPDLVRIALILLDGEIRGRVYGSEMLAQRFGKGAQNIASLAGRGFATIAFEVGVKTQDISNGIGTGIIKIGYLFVPEPTRIYDVKVEVLSSTSAKITWKTNHPANGKVNYGLDETYPFDVQTDKRTNDHEFTLTDLKPNTQYSFEVMSQNRNYVYDANRKFVTGK